MIAANNSLSVGGLGVGLLGDLGIQMLELTGFDSTATNERIDLTLLQANHTTEPLSLIHI